MYFWKIDKLKDDLKIGRLTQKDEFLYTFFWAIFYQLSIIIILYDNTDSSNNKYWFIIATIDLLSVLGIYYIYIKNGASSGKDFIKRYCSLSLVVSIRVMVFSLPFMITIAIVSVFADDMSISVPTNLVDILFTFIIDTIYIYLVAKHISDVAKCN